MHAFLGVAFWTVIKNTYVHATLKENRDSCVVLLIMCKKPTFLSTFAEGLGLFPVKGFATFGQMLYTVKACACTQSKGLSLVGRCCTLWRPGSVPYQRVCHLWSDAVHCEGLGLYPVKGFVTHVQRTGAGHCDLANTYSWGLSFWLLQWFAL